MGNVHDNDDLHGDFLLWLFRAVKFAKYVQKMNDKNKNNNEKQEDLNILRMIFKDPDVTQRKMANELGLSLGKLNYCLTKLKEKGIIHTAYQSNNEVYYAICGMDCSTDNHSHNHVHFKCLKCKTVTCEDLLNSLKISLPKHEIHNVAVNVNGICEICR